MSPRRANLSTTDTCTFEENKKPPKPLRILGIRHLSPA